MTASVSGSPREVLADRLSKEMAEAERQGFGTSTVWLTREETELICAALEAAATDDGMRLDFLDRCAAAMTARDGSDRGWRMSIDQDHLMLGTTVDTHGLPSCRDAIDERTAELHRAQAIATRERHRQEPFPTRPDSPHDCPAHPYTGNGKA
ncbi:MULTISPECIES: hypothetical protein [Methylorubrum]|uniref:hypothetical protein n=1 Tax=Methylorubrum TaxID=2282523 RepID=UPI00209E0FB9|nr:MULTISPECIES: hypothetical protein [Methylorubrum]MCP1550917.1 hypothetical protein [Methylorubrum zatmanii]MCP1552470.1 hypothetical protein [Methylorubrum extorquens]MCP1581220.1 hypothetical protein [Methylorubrum extorquens]